MTPRRIGPVPVRLQAGFEAGGTVQGKKNCPSGALWLRFNHFPIPKATVIISDSRDLRNQNTVDLPRSDIE